MIALNRSLKRYIDKRIDDAIFSVIAEKIKNVATPDNLLTLGRIIAPGAILALSVKLLHYIFTRVENSDIVTGNLSKQEFLDQIKAILLVDENVRNNQKLKAELYKINSITRLIGFAKKIELDPKVIRELEVKKSLFAKAKLGR